MFNHNDTINSTQNSTINITQLMATTTTTNRKSRFVHPAQALPVPEDEDIYVSLQVLQAQLSSRSAPSGTQELLERVLSKVDKLQATVNNINSNNDELTRQQHTNHEDKKQIQALESAVTAKDAQLSAAQKKHMTAAQDIVRLQDELVATKEHITSSHKKDMDGLRQEIGTLRVDVERHNELEQQMQDLRIKLEQLESVQQEKIVLEDKYRIEQIQNNELLRRNWFLESENNKLKKAIAHAREDNVKGKEKQDTGYDTLLLPIEDGAVASIRAILEQEQREKIGHASMA